MTNIFGLPELKPFIWATPTRLMVAIAYDVNEARVMLLRDHSYLDLQADGLLNEPANVTEPCTFVMTTEG